MTDERRQKDSGPVIRDLIMGGMLLVWMMYAVASVIQLFMSGAQVLDSLPPFWFWGIPLTPYAALYQPWIKQQPGGRPPVPPVAPDPPEAVA